LSTAALVYSAHGRSRAAFTSLIKPRQGYKSVRKTRPRLRWLCYDQRLGSNVVRAGERAARMMVRAGAWGRGTHPAPTLCEHRFVTDALSKAYSNTSRSPCFPLRFSSDLHAVVARAMECEQSCCSCSALCGREVRVQAATTTLKMSSSWNANHTALEHTLWLAKQVLERTAGQVCSPPASCLKKTSRR
jgi:hypothetical protein